MHAEGKNFQVEDISILCGFLIALNFSQFLQILQLAGLENQTVYFVLEDYQIICDAMYDFVNSFLASGEVKIIGKVLD